MKAVRTLFLFTIKEQFNLWRIKRPLLFILKTLFLIGGAFLISSLVKPTELMSTKVIFLIIVLQAIILTWIQALLEIGDKLLTLNKVTLPSFLGVNHYVNIFSIALFYTYRSSLVSLSISIIYANTYLYIPVLFFVFLSSTLISFQLVTSFMLFWVRMKKSLNSLVILSYLSQFILIGGVIYLFATDYQFQRVDGFIDILSAFLILYFLIAFIPLLINLIKPKWFNLFYQQSINNYHDSKRVKSSQKKRYNWIKYIKNPVIYKDIILTLSNPITKVRLYLWGLIQLVMIYLIVEKGTLFFTNLLPYSVLQPEWFVLHSSLLISYLVFGEVILSLFQMDKGIIQWYSFTGFKPHTYIQSKIITGFGLLMIPNTITLLSFSIFIGLDLREILSILILSFLCLLIIVVITLSISSLEVNLNLFSRRLENLVISQQIPQTPITFVSLFSGFFFLIIFYLNLGRATSLENIDLLIIVLSLIFSFLFYVIAYKKYEQRFLADKK